MAFPAPDYSISLPLPDPEAYPGEPREYARALMQRKDEIEKEIEVLKDVLASHNVTPQTPLLDPEGYPRGDIDIYAIRHARAALNRLYNDRTQVTQLIATALEAAFSPSSFSSAGIGSTSALPNGTTGSGGSSTARGTNGTNGTVVNGHSNAGGANGSSNGSENWPDRAVAKVNTVAPSSPAEEAGLRPGDMIYSFAGVTASEMSGLQAIGAVVARSEGVSGLGA